MSTLTQQEREGLEDVFRSIHTSNKQRVQKRVELSSFIITPNIGSVVSKVLKQAKIGLKKRKTFHFLSFFNKKKKSLSK